MGADITMISGKLIGLSAVKAGDCGPIFDWINDAALAEFDRHWRPTDWSKHVEWFQSIGKDDRRVIFAIHALHDQRLVGLLCINDIHPVHHAAELGLVIGLDSDRDQGFGGDAVRLGLRYCFDALNLNRVQISVFSHNARALHLYQKMGFVQEGVLREQQFISGKWADSIVMAMLRKDFQTKHKQDF